MSDTTELQVLELIGLIEEKVKSETGQPAFCNGWDGSLTPAGGEVALRIADALEAATKPRTVEWGVDCGLGGVAPFEGQAACERFIKNPPLWFSGSTEGLVIVSRLAATDWEPFTPTDAGSN